MRLYYQHFRSLVSKISTLIPPLSISCFYVIAFYKTWLSPTISNAEFNCINYAIHRCDRYPCDNSSNRGGGVLVAVNSTLKSEILIVSINVSTFFFCST